MRIYGHMLLTADHYYQYHVTRKIEAPMKSLVISLIVLLLATMSLQAQTQDEVDEALRYYPLEVGNYWEYKVVNDTPPHPPETYYFSIEVISDTVLSNTVEYKKIRYVTEKPFYIHHFEFDAHTNTAGFRTAYTLERVDPETANVYRLNPNTENEYDEILIDSLLTSIFESSSAIRWDYGLAEEGTMRLEDGSFTLSQQTIPTRFYDIPSAIYIAYSLGENFGLVEVYSGENSESNHKLIYFRNHLGNEFGDAVHVSTPSPPEIPKMAALLANYPNPFNPTTTIPFELAQADHVRLEVYDMLGRQVSLLVNETRQVGQHTAVFEAGNLPSGMYIARLQTRGQVFTSKLMLVK